MIRKTVAGFQVVGFSLAGEETVIALPELNVCFDFGRAPREIISIDHVCLSHGHMDHSAGLAYYLSQRHFLGISPGCVIAPHALVEPIRQLLRHWTQIEGHPTPYRLIGLGPDEQLEIRRNLLVRGFEVNHNAPALGYAVIETRRKLKPELAGKSPQQLVALKRQGVEIEYTLEVPLVAYCGDTAEGDFLQLDYVRRARLLLLECTFFDPAHVRRARAGYHLHVLDLRTILQRIESEHVILFHQSRRTQLREAKQALAAVLPPDQRERVSLLMDYSPRRSRAEAPSGPPG